MQQVWTVKFKVEHLQQRCYLNVQNRTEQNRNSFISSSRRTIKYNTIKEK